MQQTEKTGDERERVRDALVSLIAERGYSETDLEAVLARSGVGREGFERLYGSLDECFGEVWDEIRAEFLERAWRAYDAAPNWREGIRARTWEFCRFLEEDRVRARIMLVELTFAGEEVRARRDFFLDAYVELLTRGQPDSGEGGGVPRARAEAIAGAVVDRVTDIVKSGELEELAEGVPQLMYLVVLPYLGQEAAREELRRGPDDIARYRRGEL